jgi:transcriptional regulator with XRE-family HTH domain
MSSQFGNKIRTLREEQNLLLRQVASILEMDTAQLSKIERGERQAKKETVLKIAVILKVKDGESSKGCCHNETKVCKLNDTHLQNHEFQNFQPIIAIVEPKENSFFQKTDIFLFRKVTPKVYHPPPLHLKTPIFIKNRVLII